MAKPLKYIPLKDYDDRKWIDPYDFYTHLNVGHGCNWWGAKLTGFDTQRNRYVWHRRVASARKTYRREFLPKLNKANTHWLEVGHLAVGDLLEFEESKWNPATKREHFKVAVITDAEIVLEPKTKRWITINLQKLTAPKPVAQVVVRKGDAVRFYKQLATSSDFKGRFASMAQILVWLSAALKQTIAQRKHAPDVEKKLGKIKKLRQRAGHDATPQNEKEACLSVAIKLMEACVAPEFLPKANITLALADTLPKEVVATAPPRTATRRTGAAGPTVQPTGAYAHSPEVLPIGEAILIALGLDTSYMRVSKVRVTIKHPKFGSKALFTMFSKASTVQFMCPVFDQLGITAKDRLGMYLVELAKPINQQCIDEAVEWAKKVEALL